MFGKVKKWLGIEGIKVALDLPDIAFKQVEAVSGKIRFFTKNEQEVEQIKVVLLERYERGRGKDKKVDEYNIGEILLKEAFTVPADEVIELDFTLPFKLVTSQMDEFATKNIFTSSVAKLAKSVSNVKSTYFIEVTAEVKGTALSPFDKQQIILQ